MTTTMVYHAAVRGIELEEVESELEGDLDLKGFMDLSDEVALIRFSPVYDVVSNGTRVKVQVERK
jgi:transcriptional regulator NrdR family protein